MSIKGTWHNELHSTMRLIVQGNNLSGTYQSFVGKVPGPQKLVGLTQKSGIGQTIGFTVTWRNSRKKVFAQTTWCGQYQIVNGEEIIVATWLLISATKPKDNWESTIVGQDVFRRVSSSTAARLRLKKLGAASHKK